MTGKICSPPSFCPKYQKRTFSLHLALAILFLHQIGVEGAQAVVRVGLLVQGPPIKGIFRDAETLAWALDNGPLRVQGASSATVSVFYTPNYAMLDAAVGMGAECIEDQQGRSLCQLSSGMAEGSSQTLEPHAVREGTKLESWLGTIDDIVVMESALPNVFSLAHKRGVRSKIIFLNLEWSDPRQLNELDKSVPGLLLAVKGAAAMHVLSAELVKLGSEIKLHLVPWSISDPVVRVRRAEQGRRLRMVFVAGLGGIRNRRGGDIVLEAYRELRDMIRQGKMERHVNVTLDFWSARHPEEYDVPVERGLLKQEGLVLHTGHHPREAIQGALSQADLVLYPSRFEGFGLSLLEALHAGLPVIATDGWPMNELVEDGHNGLLVRATPRQPGFGLSPSWEMDPKDLAAAVVRFASDDELRSRTTCPAPSELLARQHRFVLLMRSLVLSEPSPLLVSFYAGPHHEYPRAELFRSDALRSLGYNVVDVPYDRLGDAEVVKAIRTATLLLISKPPSVDWVRDLKKVRGQGVAPMYMWFWDPIDYSPQRRQWFIEVSKECDASFVNEKGREGEWAAVGLPHVGYIEEGCMHLGDRGLGKRPKFVPRPGTLHDVSFQGTVYPYPPDFPRVEVILYLLSKGVRLAVYGPHAEWEALNITSLPPSYGEKSHLIHRESKVTLSLSRLQPGTELYRSERLMDGAGAGGCVLSEVFPGLDLLLPEGSVMVASTPQEYLDIVAKVAADPSSCGAKRQLAVKAAWGFHSWQDSAIRFLSIIRDQQAFNFNLLPPGQSHPMDCARPLTAGASCCGQANYNFRHGELLMSGSTPWRIQHTVEASIYLSGAIQDCPSSTLAWESMASALLMHGDVARSLKSHVVAKRLSGASRSHARHDRLADDLAWLSYNFGPTVAKPLKDACEDAQTTGRGGKTSLAVCGAIQATVVHARTRQSREPVAG